MPVDHQKLYALLVQRLRGVSGRRFGQDTSYPDGQGYTWAFCPVPRHQDGAKRGSRSLHLSPSMGVKCFADCGYDEILQSVGIDPKTIFDDSLDTDNVRPFRKSAPKTPPAPKQSEKREYGNLVATYEYRHLRDNTIYQKGRFEQGEAKTFLWRKKGDGPGWPGIKQLYGIEMWDLALFGSEDLKKAPIDQPVFFVEGEKAAEACHSRQLLAVTTPGGSSVKQFGEQLDCLRGRTVYLWPDNDGTGYDLMRYVYRALRDIAAKIIYVRVNVPEKGDAVDYFEGDPDNGREPGTVEGLFKGAPSKPILEFLDDDRMRVVTPTVEGQSSASVLFSNLERERRSLRCEISVSLLGTGTFDVPYTSHLDLMSVSNIEAFRRALDNAYGKEYEWTRVLNGSIQRVIEGWRNQDRSVDTADIPFTGAMRYHVQGLFPLGEPTVVFGTGMCIAAGTMIDGPDGSHAVEDLARDGQLHRTWSVTPTGVAPAWAEPPVRVGQGPLLTIKMASGRYVTVATKHRFLTREGWQRADELEPGVELAASARVSRETSVHGGELAQHQNIEAYFEHGLQPSRAPEFHEQSPVSSVSTRGFPWLPESPHVLVRKCNTLCLSAFHASGHYCVKTGADLMDRYYSLDLAGQCDQPLLLATDSVLVWPPSQGDVPIHNRDGHVDVQDKRLERNQLLSESVPPSNCDGVDQNEHRRDYAGYPQQSSFGGRETVWHQAPQRSQMSFFLLPLTHEFVRQAKQAASVTEPLLPPLESLEYDRVIAVSPAGEGDYYDLTVPSYQNYSANGIISRNSTKSYQMFHLAASVALGNPWCGREVIQSPVMIIDWESDVENYGRRMRRIALGMGLDMLPPYLVRYWPARGIPLSEQTDAIRRVVEKHGIGMVVIDSAVPACGMEAEKSAVAASFFNAVRSIGRSVTTIILAHTAKDDKTDHPFGCHSEDTEILTRRGWVTHADWREGEEILCFDPKSDQFRWAVPTHQHVYRYRGNMIAIDSPGMSALVTPNHRMAVKPAWNPPTGTRMRGAYERGVWLDVPASQLAGSPWVVPYANPVADDHEHLPENASIQVGRHEYAATPFARLIGFWLSEGHVSERDGSIGLTQAPGRVADEMRGCLDDLGIGYWSSTKQWDTRENCGPMTYFRTRASRQLADWFTAECGKGAPAKRIPALAWSLHDNDKRVMLEAMIDGDGSRKASGLAVYHTSSEQLADDVQRLAIELGRPASIHEDPAEPGLLPKFRVQVGRPERRTMTLRAQRHLFDIPYDGRVYCFTVPTDAYLTRRGGRTFVSRNSIFWSNLARETYWVRRQIERESDDIYAALVNRKTNDGRLKRDFGIHVHFDGDSGSVSIDGVNAIREVPGSDEDRPMAQRAQEKLLVLQRGTFVDLAKELGIDRDNKDGNDALRKALSRGVQAGKFGRADQDGIPVYWVMEATGTDDRQARPRRVAENDEYDGPGSGTDLPF